MASVLLPHRTRIVSGFDERPRFKRGMASCGNNPKNGTTIVVCRQIVPDGISTPLVWSPVDLSWAAFMRVVAQYMRGRLWRRNAVARSNHSLFTMRARDRVRTVVVNQTIKFFGAFYDKHRT
jgi:hypothetical protein